jgi:acetyl esterase/lipase
LGLTTFVLYYRLVQADGTYRYPVPMWDGQRALKLIRYRAKDYGIDSNRLGVFGFSAGGHLASTLALHSATDFNLPVHDAVDSMKGRPDFLGLGHPAGITKPSAQSLNVALLTDTLVPWHKGGTLKSSGISLNQVESRTIIYFVERSLSMP